MADYKVTVNGPTGTAGYCRWCYHIESTVKGRNLGKIGINLPADIPIVDPATPGFPFGAAGNFDHTQLVPHPSGDKSRQIIAKPEPFPASASVDICFLVPTVNGICEHNATTSTRLEPYDGTNWIQVDFVDGNGHEYPHGDQKNKMTKEIDGPLGAHSG
jgi:hypothetical protein